MTARAIAQAERLAQLEAIGRARVLTEGESREVERLIAAERTRRWAKARREADQLARARAKVAAEAAA